MGIGLTALMQKATDKVINRLAEINVVEEDGPGLVDVLHEVIDEAGQLSDPSALLPSVFEFFEKWPEAELGSPGPLVHFVERFFPGGYEKLLLVSLGRQPVPHTVWMTNRLLNSTEITDTMRARLLGALKQVAQHPRAGEAAREEAREFLEHQGSRRR